MLRKNEYIEGINVNGVRALLSQFADDMDLFIKFKQESWEAVVSTLSDYEAISGMKVNYDKTSVYCLGSIRFTNAKFYSSRKIQWTNDSVNLLGVLLSYKDDFISLNFDDILCKARQVLKPWYLRSLTILGKIQVLNSLIASLFVYRMTALPPLTQVMLDAIEKIFTDFIWEGKRAKIPLRILQGNKTDGGMRLTNI